MRTARANLAALPFVVLTFLSLIVMACGHTAPTAPDRASLAASPLIPSQTSGATAIGALSVTQFDLRNGTFSLTTPAGDTLSGSYAGTAFVSVSGKRSASLGLQVTAGTGSFQGAIGGLSGDGNGAFAGEGAFDLTLRGTIQTDGQPNGVRFRSSVSGLASLSCVPPNVLITLEGDGTIAKGAAVHGTFTHTVGGAGCGQ